MDTGLVNETADHINCGVKLSGELRQAGIASAGRHEVAAKVDEPQGMGAVVEAALLAIDDGEAAAEDQTTPRCC